MKAFFEKLTRKSGVAIVFSSRVLRALLYRIPFRVFDKEKEDAARVFEQNAESRPFCVCFYTNYTLVASTLPRVQRMRGCENIINITSYSARSPRRTRTFYNTPNRY